MTASALLYLAGTSTSELQRLVLGDADARVLGVDVVTFPAGGGTEDLELALPLLGGMDDVVVDDARVRLRSSPVEQDVPQSGYRVSSNGGQGIFLGLAAPGRLRRIVLAPLTRPPDTALVLRSAEASGSGFRAGPPILADRSYGVGAMYPNALGGLSLTTLADGGLQLLLPPTQGSAWLIQLATGDSPTDLSPVALEPSIVRVTVDAAPTDLGLVLRGDTDTPLWSQPGPLLPAAGVQEASFTPLAQRHLSQALQAPPPAGQVTLPLSLRLSSSSGGGLGLVEQTLQAEYLARPLGEPPTARRLGGSWEPLVLHAPAGRRPSSTDGTLQASPLGRELNGAFAPPALEPPSAGVRVASERWVATPVSLAPAGSGRVRVASARVYVESLGQTEAVLELRADAAGSPGALLAAGAVRRLAPGPAGWIELELTSPLPLDAPAALWVALRTTAGELRWYAQGAGEARASLDRGATWGPIDAALTSGAAPLTQLFHATDGPQPAPEIQLALGGADAGTLVPGAPLVLPAPVLDALAATTGAGRAATEVRLFSRAVLDVTITGLTCRYDPFGG